MPERVRKPEWLKISIGANERYTETKRIVESHCLHTICSSGRCPNMGECWGKGTATFMIGGNICTRCCKFCNTASGKPLPLDADEPTHVAESIALMKLSHAVVTSVDRDDLPDLGASHWVRSIREIRFASCCRFDACIQSPFQRHVRIGRWGNTLHLTRGPLRLFFLYQ